MSIRTSPWPAGVPCWLDVISPDPAAAQAFYAEIFQWNCTDLGPDYGHYAQCARDGHQAAGMMGPIPDMEPGWLLYLASDDIEATVAAVTEHGGEIVSGPHQVSDTGTFLVGVDPAGARFGVWQHDKHIGAELVNEPGGLVWEDLRTGDPDAARRFYTGVFGWTYQEIPGAGGEYTTFHGSAEFPLGGLGPLFGSPAPRWFVYFAVEDADATCAKVVHAGGRVSQEPQDTPYGRMAGIIDPGGAEFSIIEPAPEQPVPDRAG